MFAAIITQYATILEEHLDIIVSEKGGEIDEVMHDDEFIRIMLRMHQAISSRKWRLMVNNAVVI